ncbi:MAG: cation:dicarboxylase symporter family transporter [Xenococcaceae cyanobacterium MO_167.B52]|nr:cation:dicarboxylase symporter family transporter [Xenococcaceae cyanobacterium MO_167.B52]
MTNNQPKQKSLGLAELTLSGLLAGIACGLFFGEEAARLKILGDIYIRLLQMTVLPYIIFSLIGNIGQLNVEQGKLLAKRAGTVLLILWGIGIVMIVTMPLALPPQVSASFFSSSILETPQKVNLVKLFIPANIFDALQENLVPSIVVFCIASGIALIGIEKKQAVLELFEVLSQTMSQVTKTLTKVAPIGVFAITANAAGTMGFEELGRLQGYFIIYTIAFLLLTFWILPGLVAALTPFKFGEVIKISRTALVLAFSTGKALVVLPLIIENVKGLFKIHNIQSEEAITTTEVVVPLAYPFPNLGKMLAMLFVPFAAWFVGSPMGITDYGVYITAGFPSFFGSVAVAMPFALDIMRLPADMFQLFLVTGVYAANISDCLAAMHLIALTLLVACASSGTLRLRWKRVGIVLVTAVLIAGILLFGTRAYLAKASEGTYNKDQIVASMQLLENKVPYVIVEPSPNPDPLLPDEKVLERIKRRETIRIGFEPDNLPWSYYNSQKELVGFDIDLAHRLPRELNTKIEFVPFQFSTFVQQMKEDHFDLAMSGVVGTVEQSQQIRFSDPYLYINLALVVPDYRDNEFATLKLAQNKKNLRVGVETLAFVTEKVRSLLPNVEFVDLESDREFFEGTGAGKDLDALFISAEEGSAWTLLYPNFQVVTPFPRQISLPLVYPYLLDDEQFDEVLDHWIELKKKDGTFQDAYDYWILGQGAEKKEPRWSIIRNVLHWVN